LSGLHVSPPRETLRRGPVAGHPQRLHASAGASPCKSGSLGHAVHPIHASLSSPFLRRPTQARVARPSATVAKWLQRSLFARAIPWSSFPEPSIRGIRGLIPLKGLIVNLSAQLFSTEYPILGYLGFALNLAQVKMRGTHTQDYRDFLARLRTARR